MRRCLLAFGLAAILALPVSATMTTWQIDPDHANAQFVARHFGIANVQGEFTKVTGTVTLDDQDITKSKVNVTIPVDTIFTRVKRRDDDLLSQHFLDAAMYPTITFHSTKITRGADHTYNMTGNLTIRGVTKTVTLKVSDFTAPIHALGGIRRGAHATTTIDRMDFGVAADPDTVGHRITILIDIEMVKK